MGRLSYDTKSSFLAIQTFLNVLNMLTLKALPWHRLEKSDWVTVSWPKNLREEQHGVNQSTMVCRWPTGQNMVNFHTWLIQ